MREPVILFAAGSFLIALGSGFGLIQSYEGNTLLVAASLITFFSGYRLCQQSVSQEGLQLEVLKSYLFENNKAKIAYLSTGTLMMSQGFVFLTSSIIGEGMMNSLMGGALIITGYVPAHLSINETVI